MEAAGQGWDAALALAPAVLTQLLTVSVPQSAQPRTTNVTASTRPYRIISCVEWGGWKVVESDLQEGFYLS